MTLIRPLLVQFYRCGLASRDRGWRTCKTPEMCMAFGCVRRSAGASPSDTNPMAAPAEPGNDAIGAE